MVLEATKGSPKLKYNLIHVIVYSILGRGRNYEGAGIADKTLILD
jgi:hypothetical protein